MIDENGNIDAPVTTTDLSTTGNTTIGNAAADTLDINATISDDFLIGTNKKIQFRDTGIFIHSNADGKLTISSDGVGADAITVTGAVTFSNGVTLSSPSTASGLLTLSSGAKVNDDQTFILGTDSDFLMYYDSIGDEAVFVGNNLLVPAGVRFTPQIVTATADGLTTGLIPFGCSFVSASSGNANDIITLPIGTAGQEIVVRLGATGCEMRTPATSNATINGVDSDGTNELALVANGTFICRCVATNTWIVTGIGSDGAALATLTPN